jgi:hypothetical protein
MEANDWESIECWVMLFENEKSLIGVTRKVFDQSYNRLVDSMAQWIQTTRTLNLSPNVRETEAVRQLMIAQLPIHKESFRSSNAALRATYDALVKGHELNPDSSMMAMCIYVCQSLRLSPDTIDAVKKRLFLHTFA